MAARVGAPADYRSRHHPRRRPWQFGPANAPHTERNFREDRTPPAARRSAADSRLAQETGLHFNPRRAFGRIRPIACFVFNQDLPMPFRNRQPIFVGGNLVPEFLHELQFLLRRQATNLGGERGVHARTVVKFGLRGKARGEAARGGFVSSGSSRLKSRSHERLKPYKTKGVLRVLAPLQPSATMRSFPARPAESLGNIGCVVPRHPVTPRRNSRCLRASLRAYKRTKRRRCARSSTPPAAAHR